MLRTAVTTRLPAHVAGVLAAVLAAALLGGPAARPVAAAATPIMGPQEVGPAQLASWFRSTGKQARIAVSIEELAWLFVSEGAAEGVRGDIAFAQSILETGYFTFPEHGQVRPSDHNYSGIGAVDGGNNPARFSSPREGVRAQIQHLRAYADPNVTRSNLAHPLVDPRFDLVQPKGKARYWESLGNGNWATDPAYASKIMQLWAQITAHPRPPGDTPAQAPTVGGFADVLAWHPHAAGIAWASERGIVQGSGGRFHPERAVTRAQVTTILHRYHEQLGNPPTLSRSGRLRMYSDVDPRDVHAPGIRWATDATLVNGVSATRFAPVRAMHRDELASVLARYRSAPSTYPSPFVDVARDSVHAPPIGWGAYVRVVSGVDGRRFLPTRPLTRGQIASVLARLDRVPR